MYVIINTGQKNMRDKSFTKSVFIVVLPMKEGGEKWEKKYGIKKSLGVLSATVHLISRFLSSWSSSSLNGPHLVELGDQIESKDIADNLLCLSMLLGMDGLRMKEKGVVKIV